MPAPAAERFCRRCAPLPDRSPSGGTPACHVVGSSGGGGGSTQGGGGAAARAAAGVGRSTCCPQCSRVACRTWTRIRQGDRSREGGRWHDRVLLLCALPAHLHSKCRAPTGCASRSRRPPRQLPRRGRAARPGTRPARPGSDATGMACPWMREIDAQRGKARRVGCSARAGPSGGGEQHDGAPVDNQLLLQSRLS